jgi:hypothetical protein
MSPFRMNQLKFLYVELLPIFAPMPMFLGFLSGMVARDGRDNPIELLFNVIGYTSVGVMTGLMYPISYPLLGGYVLYKNFKQIK